MLGPPCARARLPHSSRHGGAEQQRPLPPPAGQKGWKMPGPALRRPRKPLGSPGRATGDGVGSTRAEIVAPAKREERAGTLQATVGREARPFSSRNTSWQKNIKNNESSPLQRLQSIQLKRKKCSPLLRASAFYWDLSLGSVAATLSQLVEGDRTHWEKSLLQ